MLKKPKVCRVCRKPRAPRCQYCERCKRLVGKGKNKRFRRAALIKAYDERLDAFLCAYTGVVLEEYDTSSPWYITYDHVIPGKKGDLVACAYFINTMKSDLSGEEFRAVVMEFDRHVKGAPFDREVVKFLYWHRKAKVEREPARGIRPLKTIVPACVICGHKPISHSKYCARCKRRWLNFPGRAGAMKAAWNKDEDGFMDHYIGIKLDEEDLDSPFFMVFDHRIPRKKGDLVVTSMLMNAMKGDLSEEEFYLVMNELARHFEGAPFNRDVVKFEYWKKW
jgi:hypothetical protein